MIDPEACSGPERSEPPIGWPPTKRGSASAGARASTSRTTAGGVIAARLRTGEVGVGLLVDPQLAVEVHEGPDHARHRTLDRQLARTKERHAPKTHPPGSLRGEGGAHLVGCREEDAHQLLSTDGVPLDH